ncbi:MAG: hypothetical protein ACKVT1_14670 [Dehalococcoidia bacterium]
MGREEIAALIRILTAMQDEGSSSPVIGSWHIHFDKKRSAFAFDKCENEGYCEERPAIISTSGEVLDPGGPLFG